MKKWWGIRHARFLWGTWQVHRWARRWRAVGIGLGHPNQSDMIYLAKIWKGEL